MTVSGWILLVFSWGFILGLTVYCFVRVLRPKRDTDR